VHHLTFSGPSLRRYPSTYGFTLKQFNPYLADNGGAADCSQSRHDYDLCSNELSLFSGGPRGPCRLVQPPREEEPLKQGISFACNVFSFAVLSCTAGMAIYDSNATVLTILGTTDRGLNMGCSDFPDNKAVNALGTCTGADLDCCWPPPPPTHTPHHHHHHF